MTKPTCTSSTSIHRGPCGMQVAINTTRVFGLSVTPSTCQRCSTHTTNSLRHSRSHRLVNSKCRTSLSHLCRTSLVPGRFQTGPHLQRRIILRRMFRSLLTVPRGSPTTASRFAITLTLSAIIGGSAAETEYVGEGNSLIRDNILHLRVANQEGAVRDFFSEISWADWDHATIRSPRLRTSAWECFLRFGPRSERAYLWLVLLPNDHRAALAKNPRPRLSVHVVV